MCCQNIILSFCIFISLFSCHCDNSIQKALTYSSGNQQELEKVIRHFSEKASDSLKLKAAYFLISNRPGHYSYVSDSLTIYHQKLYQLTLSPHLRERRNKALQLAAHYKNTFSYPEYLVMLEDYAHNKRRHKTRSGSDISTIEVDNVILEDLTTFFENSYNVHFDRPQQ